MHGEEARGRPECAFKCFCETVHSTNFFENKTNIYFINNNNKKTRAAKLYTPGTKFSTLMIDDDVTPRAH